ncbi:F-BAR and double SH3 domains protein 2-like isoform X1 [Sinocyclocheilus rhinocerous]|uniref:F-BAR and double SH3 domains protein 2-like isoform X1 n=1 Tax=Sinocyclocheilus rhinocerous TaxID=307959 RepID=UPI0007B86DE6|nr:PREDICTED: F-BAR and double SH3 domains protein 2-like isoform X1 [Sinocyclocheilus rhinocerous]
MQPPPRKVKVTQEVKHTHTEQLNRLQFKHQTDLDFLEDLRIYSQKKALIEKDCSQALHKLASQYLKREWSGAPSEEQRDSSRNVWAVWRSYLEGVMKVSQSRINGCENYRSQISDPVKTFRAQKDLQLKKCCEQLARAQADLQVTIRDLEKSRKTYQEAEQTAQTVREKADMEAKSKLSLFQSRSSLKRASVKLKAKKNEWKSKATQARNDYLLTLSAINAHQDRYYETDLISSIRVLDCSFYDHVQSFLISLCQTELETSQSIQDTFQCLLETSSGVTQDIHQQVFIQDNPVFQKAAPFQYQPCENDSVRELLKESGTAEEHSLNKEARKWATRVAREHKNIILTQRILSEYEESHQQDQNNNELELKMDDARECIRKSETMKLKAEARLNLLRDIGVAVDVWLKSAMNQVMEELENERWAALNTHDASFSHSVDFDREDDEDTEMLDDSSSSPSSTHRNYPLTCSVLYSYQASQPDELTIQEQEILELIDDGDMEDWVKARNRAGQVGYVPEKYLQLPTSSSLLRMLQSFSSIDTQSHTSSTSAEQEPEIETLTQSIPNTHGSAINLARALYAYEAQTEDELSFPEGAIIYILSKHNQEDDGFWEGEFNGAVGVFPAVLVEDLCRPESAQTHKSMNVQVSLSVLDQAASPPTVFPSCRSPESVSLPSLSSTLTLNGYQTPEPPKISSHSHTHTLSPRSPGEGGSGLRPVRAAPPPPKQQAQGQVQKREEVEITLV